MKRITPLILMLCLIPLLAIPCGNEYGYTMEGERMYTRYFYLTPAMLEFDQDAIKDRISELSGMIKENPDAYEHWSDLAVNLMKQGEVDSAYRILAPLYREHPDEYNLNANLGTCYELMGELDSALKYISRGYEINPKSHASSEWIHVKILEAKIKEKSSPGWLKSNEIVTQQFLADMVERGSVRSANWKVNFNFQYQIRTRAPFTPAPNKVITNLLMTLAKFNEIHGVYENALMAYTYAMRFEGNRYAQRQISNKIKALNRERDAAGIKNLSDQFTRIMKLSELDPGILLMGLDSVAVELDSTQQYQTGLEDSLMLLNEQKEKELAALQAELDEKEETIKSEKDRLILYGLIFLSLLLIPLAIFIARNQMRNP